MIGLAAGLLVWEAIRFEVFDRLEATTWDWRVSMLAEPGRCTRDIRLILIDQSSLDWGEKVNNWSWPWPRETYAAILEFCRIGGARAVAFDMLFTEASSWGSDDDVAFGAALSHARDSAVGLPLNRLQGADTRWPQTVPLPGHRVLGVEGFGGTAPGISLQMPKASFPVAEVATNVGMLASVNMRSDRDSVVRRVDLFHFFDGQWVPSLGVAASLLANPGASMKMGVEEFAIGNRHIPLDANGQAILRFRGPTQTHAATNAALVIQSYLRIREGAVPPLNPAVFSNAYVFVGVTAPGLLDLKPTPLSPIYPGVEIHATALDNLLSEDFMRDVSGEWVMIAVLGFALVCGVLGRMASSGLRSAILFATLLPLPFIGGILAYMDGYWLPVAGPAAGGLLALLTAVTVNYAVEGRQKRFLKGAFSQYLSPEVIERIVRDPERLKLGGETRELTIFFSDVKGFTSISEMLNPEQLTTLLNLYLTAMTDIIMEEGGTVDKYIGDAIVAFWNAPLDDAEHANRAVRAALRCQQQLLEMRPDLKDSFGWDLYARIGINTGKAVVGNMGSNQRFNYTFLGDAGNLASRLEGVNKEFGTYLLISEFTKALLSDEFVCRELGRVKVVGRAKPVAVFDPMFKADYEVRRHILGTFASGLDAYYAGRFQEAARFFETFENQDPPSKILLERCRQLAKAPPPAWDGVWEMHGK